MRSLLPAALLLAPAIQAQRPDCKLYDLSPSCTEFGTLEVEAFLPMIGGLATFNVDGTQLVQGKLSDPPYDCFFVFGWFGTVLPSPVRLDLSMGSSRTCGHLAVAPTLLKTNAGAPAWVFWHRQAFFQGLDARSLRRMQQDADCARRRRWQLRRATPADSELVYRVTKAALGP